MFTMLRYPIAVSFRLSEADAQRLNRLLERFGSAFNVRGDSARFRVLLRAVDKKLLSPWDSEEEHDGYQGNEEASQAEEMRFSQWKKQSDALRAQRRATVLIAKQRPAAAVRKRAQIMV